MEHEKIQTHIHGLLGVLGYTEADVAVSYDDKNHTLWFSITSPQTRALLARDAEALSALNHLATKMTEQLMRTVDPKHPRVLIDANDFQKRKIENLRTIAHMMAERARYFKSSVAVDPMAPHERRIVHEFLSAMPDMKTESVGEGANRHIVITYIDPTV